MDEPPIASAERDQDKRTLVKKLLVVVLVMFGFGWALVPLYRKICELTGVNVITNRNAGAEQRAKNTQVDTSRTITVEFDANKRGAWRFKPEVNHLDIHPGELVQVNYELTNTESRSMVGQAIPSYAPMQSAAYFQKLECFCFAQQTLNAGEMRRFPVVFFVDPELPKSITQITLSYTFFEVAGALPKEQAVVSPLRLAPGKNS